MQVAAMTMAWMGRAGRRFEDLSERFRLLLRPGLRAAAEAAGTLDRLDLGRIFTAPAVDSDWNGTAARIAALGITAEAGMNPGDRRALYYLVRHLRPGRVLEIGTQAGASTVHLAAALADAHPGPVEARLLSVDIKDVNHPETAAWRAFRLPQSPRDAMRRLGLGELVEFRMSRSLEMLREAEESYDLIFLDGDHRLKTVVAEIPAALGRLRPGGFLLLHDYFPGLRPLWPDGKVIQGPQLAVQRLQRAGWPIEAQPLGQLPWPTKQGTSMTSLALLGRAGSAVPR
jgi:predicted O-methyltransferase YrrM